MVSCRQEVEGTRWYQTVELLDRSVCWAVPRYCHHSRYQSKCEMQLATNLASTANIASKQNLYPAALLGDFRQPPPLRIGVHVRSVCRNLSDRFFVVSGFPVSLQFPEPFIYSFRRTIFQQSPAKPSRASPKPQKRPESTLTIRLQFSYSFHIVSPAPRCHPSSSGVFPGTFFLQLPRTTFNSSQNRLFIVSGNAETITNLSTRKL